MARQNLDGCLVSAPENIYYLTGLEHQGYFAYELLVVPRDGDLLLVARQMERATLRDQIPWVTHVGYSDGIAALPPPRDREEDLVMADRDETGRAAGLRPWEMSYGVSVEGPTADSWNDAVEKTVQAIADAGLSGGRLGLEMKASFLPVHVARRVMERVSRAAWTDASGLVDDCRIVQSPPEQAFTRRAAEISDAMMLAAIAAAGPGVPEHDIMAAVYDALFRRGGTYPGFIPLVRSTRTLEHEHGTWLRRGSDLVLAEGMVFHLMSWLLRTGRGDSFLSDTVLVTADGCEFLTRAPQSILVR
jgi:Xaa-Pro dipeptidase